MRMRHPPPCHFPGWPGLPAVLLTWVGLWAGPAAAETIVIDETIAIDPTDRDADAFVLVPFEVPAGIHEIEVRHTVVAEDQDTVLDFGLDDPDGFRGWGGGNTEPAIVADVDASRSYRPGPIQPGTWHVVIGKARLGTTPPSFRLEIELRETATLSDPAGRTPYTSPTLSSSARFYAGDLHTHSRDSGDADPTLDAMATFARDKGLDFLVITDHNTDAHVDHLGATQALHPDLLLVPGVEFTTYLGHAGGFGVTSYVDHRVGFSTTLREAVDAIHAQGGLFSINHPVLDLGTVCIGCAWSQEIPLDVDAVEIAIGGYRQSGFIFGDEARDFWDILLDDGSHAAPVGGSDDHTAGVDPPAFGSPIGDPTTRIFARALSREALLEGIRDNRVVVQLQGPDDPMVVFDTETPRPPGSGDTVLVDDVAFDGATIPGSVTLQATVTGGQGHRLRWLKDGRPEGPPLDIDADPFTTRVPAPAPIDGEERWRVEVLVEDIPRTVTGHLWIRRAPPGPTGCGGCQSGPPEALLFALVTMAQRRRRRRRRRRH